MNSPKIRIAVLDSNPKSRKHLVKLLGNETDLDVVAESEINLTGVSDVEEQKPDVILMDSNNAFTDGLETTEMVVSRFQDTRIIVQAAYGDAAKKVSWQTRSAVANKSAWLRGGKGRGYRSGKPL
jgi:DNA-binding NarL/FixJ family response regulator